MATVKCDQVMSMRDFLVELSKVAPNAYDDIILRSNKCVRNNTKELRVYDEFTRSSDVASYDVTTIAFPINLDSVIYTIPSG